MGPLGNVLQMAEEGMEGMEGAAMAGEAAMEAADMAMMGGKNTSIKQDYLKYLSFQGLLLLL